MNALTCPNGGVHHPDSTARRCTGCKQRIYDTVRGWMTMTRRGA